jgi:hypothetical protein
MSHECGKERGVLTTGKHPLSCMTQIFRNGNFLVSSSPCYWLWAYLMIIDFGRTWWLLLTECTWWLLTFERTWWLLTLSFTWWLLLTLSIPDDRYWLWAYLMIVIDFERTWWLLLTLSVPDDCYWIWAYLMIVIDFKCTWWLSLTLIVPDDWYWLWAYLMIVIQETKLDIYVFIARLIEKRKCKQ